MKPTPSPPGFRSLGLLCAPLLLASAAAAGEITGVTNASTMLPVVPNLTPLDEIAPYEVSFAQSPGDPPLRGIHVALPAGFESVTVTEAGGGGDIQIDTGALGGTWSVSNAGGWVNVVDSGPGVTSGTFQIRFDRVPGGTQVDWAHGVFTDDGQTMPGASVVPDTPGAELRVPALIPRRAYNRLQLDNGGDVLVHLSNPSVGSDPLSGDYSGDLYTKVYPKEVLLHPKGEMTVTAVEYSVFDTDWDLDDATLWSWMLTVGVESSDTGAGGSGANPGNVEPLFGDPGGVFVPEVAPAGLGNPLGTGNCPPPNQTVGWIVEESFLDTNGQPVPILTLTADGTKDYVFTHFAPGGMQINAGGVSCGPENVTYSYVLSTDLNGFPFGNFEGENTSDYLGTGYSAHGAHRAAGTPDFAPHGVDETAVVRFLFGEPTLNAWVDEGTGAGDEHGLAGANLPIGVDAGGVPTGTTSRLGWRIYSDDSSPGTPGQNPFRVGAVFGTVSPPLPFTIDVNGACLQLDPLDVLFVESTLAWGLFFFNGIDLDADTDVDTTYYESLQVSLKPALPLIGLTLYSQGIEFDTGAFVGTATQIWAVTLRASD